MPLSTADLENTSKKYSKYCDVDMDTKLKPIHKSIDDMLARLEEFQTLFLFVKQDESDTNDILSSLPNYKNELDEMCSRVDTVETLVTHIKCNLDKLEEDIDKAETELGYNEPKNKVTNIFTPLFRKSTEKKSMTPDLGPFKTDDYFN